MTLRRDRGYVVISSNTRGYSFKLCLMMSGDIQKRNFSKIFIFDQLHPKKLREGNQGAEIGHFQDILRHIQT